MDAATPQSIPAPVPSLPLPAAAAIKSIIAAVQGQANGLLLTAVWCSFLIPIAIVLLLSNPRNWKTPIFLLNICSIALGLAFGAITIYFHMRNIALNPVGPRFLLAMSCLYFFVPISTQSILLFRVIAVYPPRELSRARRLFIYGTFATIQTTRLANAIVDVVKAAQFMNTTANLLLAEEHFWKQPYTKVELFLQLAYDIFASTLFLLRLHEGGALRSKQVGQPSIFTGGRHSTYVSRLRGLFWVAVFNFVFPVILNITLIIFNFRDPKVDHGADVMVVNIYVDIICVVLATVWCSGTHWQSSTGPGSGLPVQLPEEKTIQSISTAAFAPPSIHPLQVTSRTQFDIGMYELSK